MKSLKRTLCLVLALVMVLGMLGIASAASFSDDASIQYKEAVDVMTGIGAINGMGDGTFNPTGAITRAQAAKMVAYAVLGADIAASLTGVKSSFTDVDANFAWAIPSIEYLVQQGVINGRGDGTFDPNGSVTGHEIAKMLLCAIGYGANGEYVGTGWDLNVAIDARNLGIYDGRVSTANALGSAANREECALYCFNALTNDKAYQVRYSALLGRYLADGDTIGWEVYYLKPALSTGLDGLYGHKWAKGTTQASFTDFYVDDVYVASFSKGTTYRAMATSIGVTYTNTKGAKWYANGALNTTLTDTQVNALLTNTSTPIETRVDVYVSALTGEYKMMATYEYLAKVKTVTNDSLTGYDTVVFTVYTDAATYDVTMGTAAKIAKGTYVRDDYYIVVPQGDSSSATTLLSIKAPTTVDGKVTGTGAGYIRVAGKQYAIGASNKQIDSAIDYNSTTFTFYLDSVGNIVGYKVQSVSTTSFDGFVYVAAEEYKVVDPSSNPISGSVYSAVAKANIYVPGASAATVDLATYYDSTTGKTYLGTSTAGTELTADGAVKTNTLSLQGWCAYIDTTAGYVLVPMADTNAADVTLKAGSAAVISGKYADANTLVNVFSYNSTTKAATVASYTGTANYPSTAKTYADASYIIVVSYDTTYTNLVKSINIFDVTVSTQAINYAVYAGQGEQYSAGNYYQGFYVGGEYVEYKLASGVTLSAAQKDLYNITLNASGEISVASKLTGTSSIVSGTVGYVGSTYIVVNDNVYYYGTGYASYNLVGIASGSVAADTVVAGDTVTINVVDTAYAGIALITARP